MCSVLVALFSVGAFAFVIKGAETDGLDSTNPSSTRFGPWNLFDSRSSYGKGEFPEPFLVDDSDLETNEFRLDWFHQEAAGQQGNQLTAELEKGFSLVTLEAEIPDEYNTSRQFNPQTGRSEHFRQQGFANINLGARTPFFQFVSDNEFIDTTFGFGAEVGIPTNSPLSKTTELVPKLFNDTRIGDHFTMQSIIGYSWLLGSAPDGGLQTFEYGIVFGWTFQHRELPLPDVQQFIPVLELSGQTLANTPGAGNNSLIANAAFRANLRAIGPIQPRLGVGYVFPLDQGGRAQLHWGVFTSLVFEF